MTVVSDPDLLAQGEEVVFNTISQKVSVYPVGANTTLDTNVANGTATLTTANSTVVVSTPIFLSATNNDIVILYNTHDAGHYRIGSIAVDGLAATLLNVDDTAVAWATPTSNNQVSLRVYLDGSNGVAEGDQDEFYGGIGTGVAKDGILKQALYSFSKDEWNNDAFNIDFTKVWPLDDLIYHPFPYEPITSEQFEVGGGLAHGAWTYFNDYTIKKIRTGGWADKTDASTNDQARYTGIVTLGTLDTDAQVYYQQSNATATPVDFTFKGVVNEPIRFYLDTDQNGTPDAGENKTTFLKLFVRKKGKTYAGSQISDIGVSTIQTIVNRFPLTHATDTAITDLDATVIGVAPFQSAETYNALGSASNTDLTKAVGGFTLTKAGGDFSATGLVANDTIWLSPASDPDGGKTYTVNSVSTTTLTVRGDADFSGWLVSNTTVDIAAFSRIVNATKAGGDYTPFTSAGTSNGIVDLTGGTGAIRDDSNAPFANTAAGDLLVIRGSNLNNGVYKIMSVTNAVYAIANTTDQVFPSSLEGGVSYYIAHPGMYLQYKKDPIYTSSPNVVFTASGRTIAGEVGTAWSTVTAGHTVVIEGSGLNDGTYTVLSVATSNTITLVTTDSVVDETLTGVSSPTITITEGFLRSISGVVYGFNWRLSGNDNTLSDCYQFVQHELRQAYEIDWGPRGSADGIQDRGDITSLLMTYASPTGTTLNLFIDDLDPNDINNSTFQDGSAVNRNFPFTASGSLNFNDNLQSDTNAKYWLFYQNGFGTKDAIVVNDFDGSPIQGTIGGQPSVSFTYDYDNNTQDVTRTPGVDDADVYLVCLGLSGAQYVIQAGSIARTTGQTITAVAALERNYLAGSV